MSSKSKLSKLLAVVIVVALLLCLSSTAFAATEFVRYTITYHCNYTPAAPDVSDGKVNIADFTIKDIGTDPEDCNFSHPLITYQFQGWSTSSDDGTVEYEPGDSFSFSGWNDQTLHLYAVWKQLLIRLPYKVQYYANYPPGSTLLSLIHEDSYFAGATVTTRPASTYANSDGTKNIGGVIYEFSGWSLTSSGNVEYYPEESFTMPAENVKLYGVWTTKPVLNRLDHFAYMQGYPDGTFGPTRNMTRAEAVVMFSRLFNQPNE